MAIKVNSCTIVTDSRQLQNIANYNNSSTSFFAGQCAGQSITTGTDNTLIGACAGRCTTAGSSNLFFGTNAGCAVTTGVSNTIIGSVNGTAALSSTVILAAGTCERLKVDSSGLFINGSAFTPGTAALSGGYNFFVTCGNPSIVSGACNNIAIGCRSGCCLTTGSDNVLLGRYTGGFLASANQNVFIGSFAGQCVTTNNNVLIGYTAGCNLTTGCSNTIIGQFTGNAGLCNTLVITAGGTERLRVNATGLYINSAPFSGGGGGGACLTAQKNFFVTEGNPIITSTGCFNTAIGSYSGFSLSFGSCNTFIGRLTGYSTSTGCNNFFAGACAGYTNTTGSNNVFIGSRAGHCATTSTHNFFIGCDSGRYITTGSNNIAIGRGALRTGGVSGRIISNNIAIGQYTGFNLSGNDSSENIFIGNLAGRFSAGASNILVGSCTGYSTTGSCNTIIGYFSGKNSTTAQRNTFLGTYTGRNITTGAYNLFAGLCAGTCNTTGSNNLLFGYNSGVGTEGLANITTESNRIIMGNSSHTCAQIQIAWTAVSDVRDKCIFGPVPHGKGFLNQINPITFSFKNRETDTVTDIKKRYGFSAQEILSLEGNDPVLVGNDNPDKLGLTTEYLIPILVNAIKEMSQEIDTLKANQESMLTEINLLKAKTT